MSGVGSTNAMKKGSGNNPFLAYSKADMQGFLNSAYTGRIVKYAGSSTKTGVPRGNNLNLGDAQNLVVDLTKSFTYNQGLSKSRKWYITIDTETGNKCIMDITINKQTGEIGTPVLISDTIKALIYSIYTPYSSLIGRNINELDVKFLSVTGTDVDRDVVTNWPTTSGWQKDCFNDSGKITLWGYGEKVTAIQNQNDMDYWSAYPILYTEPYVANVLYKVVYGNGQYYFEEYYHISENVTTATVEDVAPGKTFYDFTGTKQTGTGTKINPYLATDLDTFKSFPAGSFIKWLGPNRTVLDETTGQMLIQNEIYRYVEDGDIFQYVILPTLSNPADPIDVAEGKEVINQLGAVMIGTGNVVLRAATTEGMQALFTTENIGKVVQYVGETDVYIKDAIYQIVDTNEFKQYYELPMLTNEGTAADLVEGKQLINSKGEAVEGTAPAQGDYTVKVIDYDGTVLLEKKVNTGDVIDLPTAPTHDKLVFQEWSASVAVSDNKVTIADNDIIVGAVYTTVSGQNEFDITLTKATGLTIALYMDGTKDWGDGTSDTATSHTYTAYGDYTIKCNGTKMTTSSSSGLFGQSSSIKNYYCTAVRFATVTNIGTYAFNYCYSLTNIVISNSVISIKGFAFYVCASLISIVIPNSVTSIETYAFYNCYSLINIVIPNSVTIIQSRVVSGCSSLTSIVIPNNVTSIGGYAFCECPSLTKIIIPNGVTSIGTYAFSSCNSLTNIVIPNSVTSIGTEAFAYLLALTSIVIPSGMTSIKDSTFSSLRSLINVVIPNSITKIGGLAFYSCYSLTSIVIPNSVTSIGDRAFGDCYSLTRYDFSQHTSVPTLTNKSAFSGINGLCKIIVPDNLYDEWIAASNWSTYANYIYKASEVA